MYNKQRAVSQTPPQKRRRPRLVRVFLVPLLDQSARDGIHRQSPAVLTPQDGRRTRGAARRVVGRGTVSPAEGGSREDEALRKAGVLWAQRAVEYVFLGVITY